MQNIRLARILHLGPAVRFASSACSVAIALISIPAKEDTEFLVSKSIGFVLSLGGFSVLVLTCGLVLTQIRFA